MSIPSHYAPPKDELLSNVAREPEGERIRAELIDFLERNKIVTLFIDTDQHRVEIDIVKLPGRVTPKLTHYGSIYVVVEDDTHD